MGGAMLSKSLIQLSADGQGCAPSLLFDLRGLLWGHCSFLLGPGAQVSVVPAESISQSCGSSGSSMVGLMASSSKRAYAIPRSTAPRAPAPAAVHCWPIPLQETLKHSSVSVSVVSGSWFTQGLFEPSEHLWQECGLILNANSPLLPSCWGFSFALGRGVSPHSLSSTYRLTGAYSLHLDIGYLFWWDPTFTCWWLFSCEL